MPIDIQCSECKKRFRVPDKFAGRRIKCPNCKEPIVVQAAAGSEANGAQESSDEELTSDSGVQVKPSAEKRADTVRKTARPDSHIAPGPKVEPEPEREPASEEKGQWYLQTDDGEQYGPVDREELNAWVAEGRIDGTCQLLCDGWDQWQWADEVFPALAEEASTEDSPITVRGDSGKISPSAVSARSDTKIKARHARDAAAEDGIERTLAETRPWVLLWAVVGLVISGLGSLGALVGLVLAIVTLAISGILVSLVMLGTHGLAGWASFYLLVYAQRIQAYVASSGTAELQQALIAQRSFWRLAGILTLITLGVWLLTALLLLILAAAGALGTTAT